MSNGDFSAMLREAKTLPSNDNHSTLSESHADAAINGAQELANYMGSSDFNQNLKEIRQAVRSLIKNPETGKIVDNATYVEKLNDLYGEILTGHPVFGRSPEAAGKLSKLVTHYMSPDFKENDENSVQLESDLRESLKATHEKLTVESEREQSHKALRNIHKSMKEFEKIAIDVARKTYPDTWKDFDYSASSVGTWIPFDWDGRTDIEWHQLVSERLLLQKSMIDEQVLPAFRVLQEKVNDPAMGDAIEKLSKTVRIIGGLHSDFTNISEDDYESVEAKLRDSVKDRIIHPQELVDVLDDVLATAGNDKLAAEIVLLRSRLKNHGLTLAKPHFRINAKSVLTALSEEEAKIGENTIKGNTPKVDGTAFTTTAKLFDKITGRRRDMSFQAIKDDRKTIAKQMGVIQLFQDTIDAHIPNRFLIAETHNATTPLAALYFAKLFGVDKNVEICPLIEDSEGLDHAPKFMKRLFANESYLDYLSLDRSHNYITEPKAHMQVGYSDSGRELGGIASIAFAERVKCKVVNAVANIANRLPNIRLVIFDTHGEGPGRGNAMKDIEARHHAEETTFYQQHALKKGVKIGAEESFQGGDGFLKHGTPELSLRNLTVGIKHRVAKYMERPVDPVFYDHDKSREDVFAFVMGVREKHEASFSDTGYANLVDVMKNMLPITGSRPVKRPDDSGGQRKLPRAIQHNGSQQRLAALATLIDGVGTAIRDDEERFIALYTNSPEFRQRMDNTLRAHDLMVPEQMSGYLEVLNPDTWYKRARQSSEPKERKNLRELATRLGSMDIYNGMRDSIESFSEQYDIIEELRQKLNHPDDPRNEPGYLESVERRKRLGGVAHAVSIAEIEKIFEKVPDIPIFGHNRKSQDGKIIDRDNLIDGILRLESHAFDDLQAIFGSARENGESRRGYRQVRSQTITPMVDSYDAVKEASYIEFENYMAVG